MMTLTCQSQRKGPFRHQLIMDHHEAFCMSETECGETERGKTDLLEIEIDTGEELLKK